jgi:putative DNA primase/helicase
MTSRLTDEQKNQVKYWIGLGCDLVACNTRTKKGYKEKWSNNRVNNYDYNARLEQGFYDDGVAIICGQLRRGPHKGKWLTCLDFDNLEAFAKFGIDYKIVAEMTRVEWAGNLAKVHVFIITDKPIKDADKNGLEIKSTNSYLAFVSPSINKNNQPYRVFNFSGISQLTDRTYDDFQKRIANVIPGYPGSSSSSKSKHETKAGELSDEVMEKIMTALIPYYTDGQRDHVLFGLAGLLCKSDVSQDSAISLAELFSNNGDLDRNRKIVEDSYKKGASVVSGYKYLQEHTDIPEVVLKVVCDLLPNNDSQQSNEETVSIIQDISEKIMEKYDFATIAETKEIRTYDNGVYVPGGDILIEKEAESLYGYDLKNKILTEVKSHIMRQTYHWLDEFDSNINIKNMTNGLYDFMADKFMDHTASYLSLHQIPIPYDRKAVPKYFGKFLGEILYPLDIRTITELMAYTFYGDNPFELIVILLGTGANGKSVLCGVLTSLHGSDNVSNVTLKEMIENRYALVDLVGKNVNIDTEMSSLSQEDMSMLKRLTGRGRHRVEQKNVKAYHAPISCKYWFCANKIPQTYDDSNAFYRRRVLISFPNTFETPETGTISNRGIKDGKGVEDTDLLKKLTSPEEMSGIFNILMAALRRVVKNKSISMADSTIKKRREKYELSSNPILAFGEWALLEEAVFTDIVFKEDLYTAYRRFCTHNKLIIEPERTFSKLFKQSKYFKGEDRESTKKDKKSPRRYYWVGIALAEYAKVEEKQETLTA